MIGRLLRRVLGSTRPVAQTVVVLAPGFEDADPIRFALDLAWGARYVSAGSDTALEHLQALGERYDLGFSQ